MSDTYTCPYCGHFVSSPYHVCTTIIGKPTVTPGSYKQARGIIPWEDGDELPEVSIWRLRGDTSDLEARLAAVEAQLAEARAQIAELTRRLDESEGGK